MSEEDNKDNAAKLARLNDAFRRSGKNVVMTPGVMCLKDTLELLKAIFDFSAFTEDNDPYGEHDFGAFDWHGEKVFWKIDYYDGAMEHWEDPLSPKCQRVLTVMLASEY